MLLLWRLLLLYESPVFSRQNIPATIPGATLTRVGRVVLDIIAVVIAEFFADLNITARDHPDGAGGQGNITVWVTGVVDIAGRIFEGLAVDIVLHIERENVDIAFS
jgi:hypothetical protein